MAERIAQAQALIGFAVAALVIIASIPEKREGKWPWER